MCLAVGTSLLVITMNALSGFLGYTGTVPVERHLVGWFTAIAANGSVIGTLFSKRVPQRALKADIWSVVDRGVTVCTLSSITGIRRQ